MIRQLSYRFPRRDSILSVRTNDDSFDTAFTNDSSYKNAGELERILRQRNESLKAFKRAAKVERHAMTDLRAELEELRLDQRKEQQKHKFEIELANREKKSFEQQLEVLLCNISRQEESSELEKGLNERSDPEYVTHLQSQFSRAKRNMEIMGQHMKVAKQHYLGVIKSLEEEFAENVEEKARGEVELMTKLSMANYEKQLMREEFSTKMASRQEDIRRLESIITDVDSICSNKPSDVKEILKEALGSIKKEENAEEKKLENEVKRLKEKVARLEEENYQQQRTIKKLCMDSQSVYDDPADTESVYMDVQQTDTLRRKSHLLSSASLATLGTLADTSETTETSDDAQNAESSEKNHKHGQSTRRQHPSMSSLNKDDLFSNMDSNSLNKNDLFSNMDSNSSSDNGFNEIASRCHSSISVMSGFDDHNFLETEDAGPESFHESFAGTNWFTQFNVSQREEQ